MIGAGAQNSEGIAVEPKTVLLEHSKLHHHSGHISKTYFKVNEGANVC